MNTRFAGAMNYETGLAYELWLLVMYDWHETHGGTVCDSRLGLLGDIETGLSPKVCESKETA